MSEGMVYRPLLYSSRVDTGDTTTSKPKSVKKANQKGRFSYILRARGRPILPRLPSTGFKAWIRSTFHWYMSGSFSLPLTPRGRSHLLPEMNFLPFAKMFTVRAQWLAQRPQLADLAVWVKCSNSSMEKRVDLESLRLLA